MGEITETIGAGGTHATVKAWNEPRAQNLAKVMHLRLKGHAGPGVPIASKRAEALVKSGRWEVVPGPAPLPIGCPADVARREAAAKEAAEKAARVAPAVPILPAAKLAAPAPHAVPSAPAAKPTPPKGDEDEE